MPNNYNLELQSNNIDLQEILKAVDELPNAREGQATPVILVNASGLITATAGTKSSTRQLAFQGATTITPSKTSQIAVSGGYYTGGDIVVAGDSNLVPKNIKNGINIFGVNGTLVADSDVSDAYDEVDSLITRSASSYYNNRVTTIGDYAFCGYDNLETASLPAVTIVGKNAFENCRNLTQMNLPTAISIGNYAFHHCTNLRAVNLPVVTTIGDNAFYDCQWLTQAILPATTTIGYGAFQDCPFLYSISLPVATTIGNRAFLLCYNFKSLYLTGSSVCQLLGSGAFTSTPIGGYSASAKTYGSIYVPASLLTSYKTATNWTYFSSRFVGI